MFIPRLVLALLLVAAAPAMAHLHVNMTPASASEGAQLAITHYGEPGFTMVSSNGRLEMWQDGAIYTVTADVVVGDEYNAVLPSLTGMRRGEIANFSADGAADLNNPPGRNLPVGYEIVSVVSVEDPALSPHVVWRFFPASAGQPALPADFGGHATYAADSFGLTPEARSYLVPVGAHGHGNASVPESGFFLFTDAPLGRYDVTLRAWDVQGYFTASGPVTFRLEVIPEPASLGLLVAASAALLLRRRG